MPQNFKMLNLFSNIFGSKNDRILRRMKSFVNDANKLEEELSGKPDSYFKELKEELVQKYNENKNDMYSILPYACLLYTSDAADE